MAAGTAFNMRQSLLRATFGVCLLSPLTLAAVQAQIYRCQSPDGTPLFQNAPGKNCKPLDLPSLTIIPSVRTPATARATTANATPADFPRVDATAQRNRDSDRKRILQDELGREQARLEGMLAEYNGGQPAQSGSEKNQRGYLDRVERLKDDITRSETNVASLRRELEGVK